MSSDFTDSDDDREEFRQLKDPVWDLISFDALTWKIIDTPQFQRLRYLKQLGTSYFVFPGASHNRFEHCIGTGYLAHKLVQHLQECQPRLGIDARDVQCVTLAGLCHDLGHGPFSHVFDGHFIPTAKGPRADGTFWCHEEASEMMLDALVKQNRIPLSQDRVNFIKDLIRGTPNLSLGHKPPEKPFLFEIVANKKNGIDVDKWDYIARDSKAVGETCTLVAARLISSARVIDNTIAYNWKDAHSVYELYYSRYSLHKRIYSHKASKAVEHMIVTALLAAEPVFQLADAIDDPDKYLYVTDSIIEDIERRDDPRLNKSKAILRKLRRRDIPKRVDEKCLPCEYERLWEPLLTPKAVAAKSKQCLEERKVKQRSQDELNQPMREVVREFVLAAETEEWTARDDLEDDLAVPLIPMDVDGGEVPLTEDDVIIDWSRLHFGMKEQDPLEHVPFYGKENRNHCIPARPDESGYLRPQRFQEVILRCYATDAKKRALVQEAFRAVLASLPAVEDAEETEELASSSKEETQEGTKTPVDVPSTPPRQLHSRSGSGSFLAPTPDGSPRGRRKGPTMTPSAPNSFTTIQRPPPTASKSLTKEDIGAKRPRRGDHEGSPEKRKKL